MERLEVSLETLASELAALEDVADEGRTDNNTAHELVEILCRLDTVKERINDCITILREAKEWDVSDIDTHHHFQLFCFNQSAA